MNKTKYMFNDTMVIYFIIIIIIIIIMIIIIISSWRASVASETLTGVKMKKSGMFVCLYIWTYVCHFVL